MSKKEEEILNAVAAAIPNMSEFDKGYFLGYSESKASKAVKDETKNPKKAG